MPNPGEVSNGNFRCLLCTFSPVSSLHLTPYFWVLLICKLSSFIESNILTSWQVLYMTRIWVGRRFCFHNCYYSLAWKCSHARRWSGFLHRIYPHLEIQGWDTLLDAVTSVYAVSLQVLPKPANLLCCAAGIRFGPACCIATLNDYKSPQKGINATHE